MQMTLRCLREIQDSVVVWIGTIAMGQRTHLLIMIIPPGGEADTRGDFAAQRIGQMAEHGADLALLDRIILMTALTAELIEEAIQHIKRDLCPYYPVPLVVVDNISVPFRILPLNDIERRIAAIRRVGLALRQLLLLPTRLLITNHMTTRFIDAERSRLVPALGDNWAIMTDLRLLLEARPRGRSMTILHSDLHEFGQRELLFSITTQGIEPVLG